MEDRFNGGLRSKTLLEIARSHPLAADVDTTANPTATPVSVDTETRGNESGGKEALKHTDAGSEPADDMDDSDLSDDSSVAEGSKAKKKSNEAKKGARKPKSKTQVCIYCSTSLLSTKSST